MDVFVARQPIFDRRQRLCGYELLYRSGGENRYVETDGDKASLAVIRNTLLVIGSERITGGRRAFINFTRSLLLDGSAFYLPKDLAVIEILEDVVADEPLVDACRKIKERGYLLALDDFILKGNKNNPLLDLADIIKIDFLQTNPIMRKFIVKRFTGNNRVKLLAEKTETREDFHEARDLGYHYFQGYFFSKPVVISTKDIPGYKLHYMQILREINRKELNFDTLRQLIEKETSLTYKLLKYINSAFFGLRQKVTSIKQALALLGEEEIKKWVSLAVLVDLGRDEPEELARVSILRARFCEGLASRVGLAAQKSELFLLGMFSLMEVFLGRPMEEILDGMPLSDSLKGALLGEMNGYRKVLELVLRYESADWEGVAQWASQIRLNEAVIPQIYAEAIQVAEGATAV
jgi:EAL and modified HD-GYP domain-containing signal transduction protein